MLAVYGPARSRDREKMLRKLLFQESLTEAIEALPDPVRGTLVIASDLNAIHRDHQPREGGEQRQGGDGAERVGHGGT